MYSGIKQQGIWRKPISWVVTLTRHFQDKHENISNIFTERHSGIMKCTYHNNDAMMRPTPMQSTNTTHNKNFKNPIKCSFSAIAKPIEDPVNNKKNRLKLN